MRIIYATTLFLTFLAAGCVTTQEKGAKGTKWKSRIEPPPPAVTPAQVEPENAHKQSQALWNEMDRQEENELLKENAAKAAPRKSNNLLNQQAGSSLLFQAGKLLGDSAGLELFSHVASTTETILRARNASGVLLVVSRPQNSTRSC